VKNHNPAPAAKSSTDSSDAICGLAQAETTTNEKSEATSRLDPFTANASSCRGGDGHRRLYYWYDPDGARPAVDNFELRAQYSEIGDDEWGQLFGRAFRRGQIDFTRSQVADARRTIEEYESLLAAEEGSETSS
jgi:hypothetical protein